MLPRRFTARPLAHRGLHDAARGRVENSAGAFRAAMDAGYGIELDVRISRDEHPIVFHDATLDRLTRETGPVSARSAAELSRIALGDSGDCIATLAQTLDLIGGRVPVLIEIKDQADSPAADLAIARAVRDVLYARAGTDGAWLALMSFNPLYVAAMRDLGDRVPRGLTTGPASAYSHLPDHLRAEMLRIAHYDAADCRFVSHDHRDLDNPRLTELKAGGATILCWTIRSQEEADAALRIADAITFEGFIPA